MVSLYNHINAAAVITKWSLIQNFGFSKTSLTNVYINAVVYLPFLQEFNDLTYIRGVAIQR